MQRRGDVVDRESIREISQTQQRIAPLQVPRRQGPHMMYAAPAYAADIAWIGSYEKKNNKVRRNTNGVCGKSDSLFCRSDKLWGLCSKGALF